MVEFFRTGRPDRDATGSLPRRDRAADGAGHRGLLPGGARGAAAARRRPVSRGPRRRRPLRRRPVAHRDGPAVPGARAGRHRVRAGLGRPRAGERRRGRAGRPDRDPPGERDQAERQRATTTSPTSSTRSTSWTTHRRSCARPGRRCARAAGCSCSTGRCRPSRRSSGRATASSSPASSSTSCTRARRSRPATSSWPGSTRPGCPGPTLIDLPSGASAFIGERDLTVGPRGMPASDAGLWWADDDPVRGRSGPATRRDRRQTMRRLLLHEARVHAIPGRTLRDLGDAILLHDPAEPELVLEPPRGAALAGRARCLRSAADRDARAVRVARPAAARLGVAAPRCARRPGGPVHRQRLSRHGCGRGHGPRRSGSGPSASAGAVDERRGDRRAPGRPVGRGRRARRPRHRRGPARRLRGRRRATGGRSRPRPPRRSGTRGSPTTSCARTAGRRPSRGAPRSTA